MINLKNVTLWSCVWSVNPRLLAKTLDVLRYCRTLADFGRVILFSRSSPKVGDLCDVINIPLLDRKQWNVFVNRVVPTHIDTEFYMSVHEDGFPLYPSMWSDDFLKYDYIGAPWRDGVVGNGGFNIESRRLGLAKIAVPETVEDQITGSDAWVCRKHRKHFESLGMTFAPVDVAKRFSTELMGNMEQSFGFHSRRSCVKKYIQGWKMIAEKKYLDIPLGKVVFQIPINTKQHKAVNKMQIIKFTKNKKLVCKTSNPTVTIVYIYVSSNDYKTSTRNFVDSYNKHHPGYNHKTIVACNTGLPDNDDRKLLDSLPHVKYILLNNNGWDIGAYIKVAGMHDCEMQVCLGSYTRFTHSGWLNRMADVWTNYGPGLYGTLTSYEIRPHFCTTGIYCSPKLLQDYKHEVTTIHDRYEFEHSNKTADKCIVDFAVLKNMPVKLLTWDSEYDMDEWRCGRNIYARGDQSNCLCLFRHSDSYEQSCAEEKIRRQMIADKLTVTLALA